MSQRSGIPRAALLAFAAMAGGIGAIAPAPVATMGGWRPFRPSYRSGPGITVAMAKRAAKKAKNRRRHRAHMKGRSF